jgi:hypothetical protein
VLDILFRAMTKEQFQCFRSRSGWDPDLTGSMDPAPDWESGSGSRKAKSPKKEESEKMSCFKELEVLYVGLQASSVAEKSFLEA